MTDNRFYSTPGHPTVRSDFWTDILDELMHGSGRCGSPSQDVPPGSLILAVTRGPDAGSLILLDQPVMTAGRHPNSDIYFDDVTVSRRHAEFRRQDGRVRVVDTSSLNGTYVNGELTDSALLSDGDKLQLGKFQLIFMTVHRSEDEARKARTTRNSTMTIRPNQLPAHDGWQFATPSESAADGSSSSRKGMYGP